MAEIDLSLPRDSQPQELVDVDRSNALSDRLFSAVVGSLGGYDAATGRVGVSTAVKRSAGAQGLAFGLDGSTSIIDMSAISKGGNDLVGDTTLLAIVLPRAVSTARVFVSMTNAANTSFISLNCGIDGQSVIGAGFNAALKGAASNGVWHTAVATFASGIRQRLLINGVETTTVASANFTTPSAASYFIGKRAGGATVDADVALVLAWARALSTEEMLRVTANPWQVFAPRSILIPVGSGGAVTHATTGALTGAGSTVAGSAAHIAKHGTSGTLTGQGAAVAGSADRAGSTVTHATSGTLTGQGAQVVGTAAHIAIHAASGVLAGAGAVVAGSAARVAAAVTHDTSGALVGPGAAISGQASGPAVDIGGGFPMPRRRTRKEIDDERRALGILPPEVVAEVAAAPVARRRITLQDLIGKKAAAQITSVDLSEAIAASRKRKRDDELLLLM